MILVAKLADIRVEIDEDDFQTKAARENWISAMRLIGYKVERENKKGEVPWIR